MPSRGGCRRGSSTCSCPPSAAADPRDAAAPRRRALFASRGRSRGRCSTGCLRRSTMRPALALSLVREKRSEPFAGADSVIVVAAACAAGSNGRRLRPVRRAGTGARGAARARAAGRSWREHAVDRFASCGHHATAHARARGMPAPRSVRGSRRERALDRRPSRRRTVRAAGSGGDRAAGAAPARRARSFRRTAAGQRRGAARARDRGRRTRDVDVRGHGVGARAARRDARVRRHLRRLVGRADRRLRRGRPDGLRDRAAAEDLHARVRRPPARASAVGPVLSLDYLFDARARAPARRATLAGRRAGPAARRRGRRRRAPAHAARLRRHRGAAAGAARLLRDPGDLARDRQRCAATSSRTAACSSRCRSTRRCARG